MLCSHRAPGNLELNTAGLLTGYNKDICIQRETVKHISREHKKELVRVWLMLSDLEKAQRMKALFWIRCFLNFQVVEIGKEATTTGFPRNQKNIWLLLRFGKCSCVRLGSDTSVSGVGFPLSPPWSQIGPIQCWLSGKQLILATRTCLPRS